MKFWLEKVTNVRMGNFELAANMRDMERDCQTYVNFKKHYDFEKSVFVILEGYLIYAYFGTATNDQPIRSYLEQRKWLKPIKVNS